MFLSSNFSELPPHYHCYRIPSEEKHVYLVIWYQKPQRQKEQNHDTLWLAWADPTGLIGSIGPN